MADFRSALKALGQGRLQPDLLRQQIGKLISTRPELAEPMLLQLRQAFEDKHIGKELYDSLNSHISSIKGAITEDATVAVATQGGSRQQTTEMAAEDDASTEISAAIDMASQATNIGQQEPASNEALAGGPIGIGQVIKHRFKLLGVLGQGGMGKVFKGIDLLKEEAKDKNPYVAIKLLNEDFKQHPEAFIALQRESSRQQRLAHPNIATVYDFDRIGSSGTQVFITMELMEGEPLNTMIKNKIKPRGGLPFEEAFPLVQGLGHALIYAHNHNIVHSDFKPGNTFLCNDGTVKVLDFGIARAVKNPLAGEGEKTLFDPGKLGALTPAYASLEMLEGEDPDTRDDIYALGCVAYELLTGVHPYKKTPANVARDKKMVPPTVKGLKRRQNKALMQSVAFAREDRSPNVEYFLEGFEGKFQWNNPWFIAAMTSLLIIAVGSFPTFNYLHGKKIEAFVSQLNVDNNNIGPFLRDQLPDMPSEDRQIILDGAREAIQTYFLQRILSVANTELKLYDYPQAAKILNEAGAMYPDSLWLDDLKTKVTDDKNQVLYTLNKKYISYLEERNLIESDESEEITDILALIKKVEPGHPLLGDRRLAAAYRNAAETELDQSRFNKALAYIESGLSSSPRDKDLIELRKRTTTAIRVAELDIELRGKLGQLTQLSQIKGLEQGILELTSLAPDSQLLLQITATARPLAEAELQRILNEGDRSEAEAAIETYGDLLSAMKLSTERNNLLLAHLTGAEREAAIVSIVDESRTTLERLLAQANVEEPTWQLQVQVNMQQIQSLAGAGDTSLSDFQNKIVELYAPAILQLANEQSFTDSYAMLRRTSEISGNAPQLESTSSQVKELEAAYIKVREEEERKIRVDGYKNDLLAQAQGFDVDAASLTLQKLKAELPVTDPFFTTEVPILFETAYLRVSEDAAKTGNYEQALKRAKEGSVLAPNSSKLQKLVSQYELELDVAAAKALLQDLAAVNTTNANQALARVRIASPERYSQLSTEYVQRYINQIDAVKGGNKNAAVQLARIGTALFPDSAELRKSYEELQVPEWDSSAAAAAIIAGSLTVAENLINQAPVGDPNATEIKQQLGARKVEVEQLRADYQQKARSSGENIDGLREALNTLQQAEKLWNDNEAIQKDKSDLQGKINEIQQKNQAAAQAGAGGLLTRETDISELSDAPATPANVTEATAGTATATATATDAGAGAEAGATAAAGGGNAAEAVAKVTPPPAAPWKPVPSGQECSTRLAGYGKRSKAICFDFVGKGLRGPLMVVVPAGEGFASSFAISKYEMSVNDYNKYCYVTKKCKINKEVDKDLPMTGIGIVEIDAFLAWLSERTDKSYRLPTTAEWRYAATAAGKQPKKDFNCRVVIGEKVLKGTGLISIKSGQQNGWGLKNYLGNAQELVRDGDNLLVLGGAFQDSLSACEVGLSRQHDGTSDDTTGFRIFLENVL